MCKKRDHCSPQLERVCMQQLRPSTARNKYKNRQNYKKKKKLQQLVISLSKGVFKKSKLCKTRTQGRGFRPLRSSAVTCLFSRRPHQSPVSHQCPRALRAQRASTRPHPVRSADSLLHGDLRGSTRHPSAVGARGESWKTPLPDCLLLSFPTWLGFSW